MPNYCDYEMKVRGNIDDVQEFYERMINYDHKPHFWRVFSADIYDISDSALTHEESKIGKTGEEGAGKRNEFWDSVKKDIKNDVVSVKISGYCAWSVETCMGESGYAKDCPEDSTSLQESSEELHLMIEVYSREPGMGFAEHYLYNNGEEIENETADYEEFCYDEGENYIDRLVEEKDDWSYERAEGYDNFEAFKILYDLDDDDFPDMDSDAAYKGGFDQVFFLDSEYARETNDIEKD